MKVFVNILKFLVVFILFLEAVSQLMGHQDRHYMFILGIHKVAKTPNLSDWQRIYDSEIKDTISPAMYDAKTGWALRPYNINSRYEVNNDGMRGKRNYAIEKPNGVIRIGLFGNSAMFSAEVSDSQALAVYLEAKLLEKGIRAEVLNLAVPGFGTEQSYLQWREKGKKYDLDVVVGSVHEMAFWANQNIFVYNLMPQSGNAHLSKPKVVIEKDKLKWVNYPTVPPEKMIDSMVIGFENQPFYEYEYFKNKRRHGQRFYENLYLYQTALYVNIIDELKIGNYPDGQVLTDSLFRLFQREVRQAGSEFVILTLPTIAELTELKLGKTLAYQGFLDNVAKGQNYLSAYEGMSKASNIANWFAQGFHYSPQGNQYLAEKLADYLIEKKLIKN
jgi:hypothetical protein